MTLKLTIISVMLLCLLAACDVGSQQHFDRDEWHEEFESRKPKKVRSGQILAQLEEQGKNLTSIILESTAPNSALACCPELPKNTLDSLEKEYQVRIRCFGLTEAMPPTADTLEYALLDAYKYNLQQGLPLKSGSQKDGKLHYLYTQPQTNASCSFVWSYRFTTKYLISKID